MSSLKIIETYEQYDSWSSRRRRDVHWYDVYDGATLLQSYTHRRLAEKHKAGKPVMVKFSVWDNELKRHVNHFRVWSGKQKREFADESEAKSYLNDLHRPMLLAAAA